MHLDFKLQMPKPKITFETLRHIAEAASGFRYHDSWFVVSHDPEQGYVVKHSHERIEEDETNVVIQCDRVSYEPPPRVEFARIGTSDKRVDLLDVKVPGMEHCAPGTFRADAVFWSLSAVEKFLTPYYASVYGDEGGRIVDALLDLLRITPATADDEAEASGAEGHLLVPQDLPGDLPFAIAHIPNSEYIGVPTDDETLGHVPRMFALRNGGADLVHLTPRRSGQPAGPAQKSGSFSM